MAEFSLKSDSQKAISNTKILFEFLSDFKNFGKILPLDKVDNIVYGNNECSFVIRGITPMTIKYKEKNPYTKIIFSSDILGKVRFDLLVNFTGRENELAECNIELKVDMNPVIYKMAQSNLQQLVNTMVIRLSQLKEEEITV